MTPLPSPYQEALSAQTAFVKSVLVTATRGEESMDLIPSTGNLTSDARRAFRWNGTLTIPIGDDVPSTPEDLLTPFGTTITVSLGVQLGGDFAVVPYGVYDLEDSTVTLAPNSRVVNLALADLANRLARYRFESPFEVPAGTDLADAVILVAQNRLGITVELEATGVVLIRPRIFGLDPSLDPARELIDLVSGFGYRIWFDRLGTLQLDQQPTPDAALAQQLLGALTVNSAFDHHPPNVVVVRGEASDGTTPVQAVAYDNDPSSPTYVGASVGTSPYGRVTHYFASPLITTVGQATLAAQNMLAGFAARAATWTVAKAYDPTVDPDDVLAVQIDESTNLPLVVEAVTVNIGGETTMECRALSGLLDPAAA